MSVLAALLVAVGATDLLRSLGPHPARARETRGVPAAGLLLLALVAAATFRHEHLPELPLATVSDRNVLATAIAILLALLCLTPRKTIA